MLLMPIRLCIVVILLFFLVLLLFEGPKGERYALLLSIKHKITIFTTPQCELMNVLIAQSLEITHFHHRNVRMNVSFAMTI